MPNKLMEGIAIRSSFPFPPRTLYRCADGHLGSTVFQVPNQPTNEVDSNGTGYFREKGRMSKVEGESTSIGFISVRKNPELGYFGGLLMLNPFGRPLEFHCTLPLKPSRAQEILYGPTLETFLCGEQIGFALISKAKERPSLLFTDSTSVLSLRNLVSLPVVWVGVDANDRSLILSQGSEEEDLETFRIEDWEVGLLSSFRADREQVLKSWKSIGSRIDLSEPFGRIDEALQEANPSTRAA